LDTNVATAMYLSADEDPANAQRIATNTNPNSARIVLQENTELVLSKNRDKQIEIC